MKLWLKLEINNQERKNKKEGWKLISQGKTLKIIKRNGKTGGLRRIKEGRRETKDNGERALLVIESEVCK